MRKSEKKIYSMEQLYSNKKTKHRLILLVNRYYLGFIEFKETEYLNKAYRYLIEYLKVNKTDLDILLAICFFSIKQENSLKAEYFFNIILKYKKFLKKNDVKRYVFYIYLKSIYKSNLAKRYFKEINKFKGFKGINTDLYILDIKLCHKLLSSKVKYNIEFNYTESFWGRLILYKAIELNNINLNIDKIVFKNYLIWAFNKNIFIKNSILKYENLLEFDCNKNSFNFEFYSIYNFDFVVKKICETYIFSNKLDKAAHFFYLEAVKKEINLENLNYYYIKSCYLNLIYDLDFFMIKNFLKVKSSDLEIVAFVFNVILSNNKYEGMLNKNKNKILQYGAYFIEVGYNDKIFYPIYLYVFKNSEDSVLKNKILKLIYPYIYKYEINFEGERQKYIYIKDYELKSIRKYEIKNKKVIISAVSNDFSYYILDEKGFMILDDSIKIRRLIPNVDVDFIIECYKLGVYDEFTIINLAKYYFNFEKIPYNLLKGFLNNLNIENLSEKFKMNLFQLIANMYFEKGEYKSAIKFYELISQEYISSNILNNILISYLKFEEFEKIIFFMKNNIELIQDNLLFELTKSIYFHEIYNDQIAVFAYRALCNKNTDEFIIDLVLNHFNADFKELINIREILKSRKFDLIKINKAILTRTIYIHNLNEYTQDVFLDLFEKAPNSIVIKNFLDYCIYEIFRNRYIFKHEVISIFEKILKKNESDELYIALAHIYLYQNYNIDKKREFFTNVIKIMEKMKINFNVFEICKNKLKNFSYIYKNKPFIYNSDINKDIRLFFKSSYEENFKSVKMKHFKFGIYFITLPVFFNETIEYYFCEIYEKGEISTKTYKITNSENEIFPNEEDEFFKINNLLIYFYTQKLETTCSIIQNSILNNYNLKGKIL